MAQAGVSSLGVMLLYKLEESAGVRPTSGYKRLTRINSIPEINPDTETIDASALEDLATREIPGRVGSPGSWGIVVNTTDATDAEWEALMAEYAGRSDVALGMWFQVVNPDKTLADYVKATPPTKAGIAGHDQNGLETITYSLAVQDWVRAEKAVPSKSSSGGGLTNP